MAQVQIYFPAPVPIGGTTTLDVLAVAGGDKAFLILDGEAGVIRIRLTRQEAEAIAEKLTLAFPLPPTPGG